MSPSACSTDGSRLGSFVCLLPPKALELGSNNELRRAFHELELQQALHGIDFAGHSREYLFLPGGGLAVEVDGKQGPSSVVSGAYMCAFSGRLDNYPYLVKKYCLNEADSTQLPVDDAKLAALRALDEDLTLNEIATTRPLSEAEVLCTLYARLGTTLLPKLRGEFAFVIFDSKMVRVLAARDPHGGIELAQARTSDGSLVIASGRFLPEGCRDLQEIRPGYFKYGWLSAPQKYAHSEQETRVGAETAAAAAQRALLGASVAMRHAAMFSPLVAPPHSESGSDTSLKNRTRRGKRAGRHQRQRQSLEEQRRSMDLHPAAAEELTLPRASRASLDGQQPVRSLADRTDWWRHPNQSVTSVASPGGRRHSFDSGGRYPHSAALSPLAPVFEPGTPPASTAEPSSRGEAAAVEEPAQQAAPSAESSELEDRDACAAVVGSIVAGMGVPRVRSAAALNDLSTLAAEAVSGGEFGRVLESIEQTAAGRVSTSTDDTDAPSPKTPLKPANSLEALQQLPPGLVDKLTGPYREEAASVRMLANLLFHSPCALCITDATLPDMPIVHVNRVFEKATGYSAAEVVGINCRFLQTAPGKQQVPSAASASIRRALDSGRAKGVRILNFRKDGTCLWNDLSIVPLRDAAGRITHHVGMQTFSPAKESDAAAAIGGVSKPAGGKGVQRSGGLKALLAKSRSCVELASVFDDESDSGVLAVSP